jgi:quercetin 2,3-dioxygenase
MIDIRPFATLGSAHHGWLEARHHFSFGAYHDRARTGWGSIRVWNDDVIAPGSGFPPHPHRDMEIITYVRTGAITHEDSLGNRGRTAAGDVQVMSAGAGVRHAEWNEEDVPTTLFQIWIEPRECGQPPSWAARQFPKSDRSGAFQILASGFADEGALPIRADARVLGDLTHEIGPGRHGYLVAATGALSIDGAAVMARDGVALSAGRFVISATQDSDIILVDAA